MGMEKNFEQSPAQLCESGDPAGFVDQPRTGDLRTANVAVSTAVLNWAGGNGLG